MSAFSWSICCIIFGILYFNSLCKINDLKFKIKQLQETINTLKKEENKH